MNYCFLGVNYSIVPWSSRYSMSESGIVLTNVSCLSGYNLAGCTYNVSTIDQCPSGRVVVRCTQGKYSI